MYLKSVGTTSGWFLKFIDEEFAEEVFEFGHWYTIVQDLNERLIQANKWSEVTDRRETITKMRAYLEVMKDPSLENILLWLIGVKEIS